MICTKAFMVLFLCGLLGSCSAEPVESPSTDTEATTETEENDSEEESEETDSDTEDSSETETETPAPVGTLQISGCSTKTDCGEAMTAALTVSATNIETVTSSASPGALALGTSAGLSSNEEPDISGCFNSYGPGECQKTAIQFYIWLASQPMIVAKDIIKGASELFKLNLENELGSFEADDGTKIEYKLESTTKFEVLILPPDGTRIYLNHKAGGDYEVKFLGPNTEAGTGVFQYLKADIKFISDSEWSTEIYTVDSKCTRGGTPPVSIKINRNADLWKGKAMVYTYKDEDACTVNTKGDSGFYTDFVGDGSHVTGAMYFFPVDIQLENVRTDELPGYDLNDICTNIPEHPHKSFLCDGWVNLPGLTDSDNESLASCDSSNTDYYDSSISTQCSTCIASLSSGSPNQDACSQIPSFRWFYMQTYYTNNYCIKPETTNLEPIKNEDLTDGDFGKSCSESSADDIKNGVFSDAGKWLNPTELRDLTYEGFYCSPLSLEDNSVCFTAE